MSITPRCACHDKELDAPGAILFGPPNTEDPRIDLVWKWHICADFYDYLVEHYLSDETTTGTSGDDPDLPLP